jgi:transposase
VVLGNGFVLRLAWSFDQKLAAKRLSASIGFSPERLKPISSDRNPNELDE